MKRNLGGIALLVSMSCLAAPLQVEVASVRASKAPDAAVFFADGTTDRWNIPNAGGNITLGNWLLGTCIAVAWQLPIETNNNTAWVNDERFDIFAKALPSASASEVREMLQNLLIERFGLQVHRASSQQTTLALVVAKGGPHLKATAGTERLPVIFAPPSTFIGRGATLDGLASALRHPLSRPVANETGIAGAFDFKLEFQPDNADVASVLQDQLGLKLETRKSTVETLIIDRVNRAPTAN